jgi:hypothetical protein
MHIIISSKGQLNLSIYGVSLESKVESKTRRKPDENQTRCIFPDSFQCSHFQTLDLDTNSSGSRQYGSSPTNWLLRKKTKRKDTKSSRLKTENSLTPYHYHPSSRVDVSGATQQGEGISVGTLWKLREKNKETRHLAINLTPWEKRSTRYLTLNLATQ